MSQKVTQNKNKLNIGIAITTIILMAIPVIITSFTGLSSFGTPYGIYILSVLGIGIYFSCVFGMFAWKNKTLYIIMDVINVVASLGFVIYAYINSSYQGGLLLHIACALLFTFGMYQAGDSYQGDNFYNRYLVPIAIDIAGLIFILWFINVNMSVVAHIVIVSIINFFTLAFFLIPAIFKFFYIKSSFDDLKNDEVEFEEETEEERAARKEDKRQRVSQSHSSYHSNGAAGTRRWQIYSNIIDYIKRDLSRQFNKIVEYANMDIRSNNRTIDSDYSSAEEINRAARSNKEIKRGINYLRRNLKIAEKNLEKLRNTIFTEADAYKSFTYNILTGRLKRKKQETNCINPSILIVRCHIESDLVGDYVNEIKFEGEDTFACEIK